jgi:Uma2 family endonuclease
MSTTLHELPHETDREDFDPARFTVDEYFGMISQGAFTEVGRFELLEGLLVRKMTKDPPHRVALGKSERALRARIPPDWHVANQEPVRLSASVPEPDLAVVRGTVEDYAKRHPGPRDVGLLIEIADESLSNDRRKAVTYARDGIALYWIVNLEHRCVEVHRDPDGTGRSARYRDVEVLGEADLIRLVIDGKDCGTIAVRDLLP